jgi:Flp pilus assembly protein TadD
MFGTPTFAQDTQLKSALAEKARQEFVDSKYSDAERDFRELTRIDSSNIHAHMFLGQSLFQLRTILLTFRQEAMGG